MHCLNLPIWGCQSAWHDIFGATPSFFFPCPLQLSFMQMLSPQILSFVIPNWLRRALGVHYPEGCLLQPNSFQSFLDRKNDYWCSPKCPMVTAITGTDSHLATISCSCFYSWGHEYGPVRFSDPDLTQYTTEILSEVGVKLVSQCSFVQMFPSNPEGTILFYFFNAKCM